MGERRDDGAREQDEDGGDSTIQDAHWLRIGALPPKGQGQARAQMLVDKS
jgi:hypothetical protein